MGYRMAGRLQPKNEEKFLPKGLNESIIVTLCATMIPAIVLFLPAITLFLLYLLALGFVLAFVVPVALPFGIIAGWLHWRWASSQPGR